MIGVFENEYANQLINLWHVCFGDEREFIESFFCHFRDKIKVGTRFEDGKIISALYCLPAKLKVGEKSVDAWYVYAVATLPEYRKRGFSSGLINELKTFDDGKDLLFLTPSSEKNRLFYKKLGFEDRFYNYSFDFEKPDRTSEIVLRKRKNESIYDLREKYLKDTPHVSWSEDHLDFAFGENVFSAFENGREIGYFHFEKTAGNYVIDEICAEENRVEDVLAKVCGTLGVKKVKVSAYCGEKCCKTSKGMIYCKFDRMDEDFLKNQFYLAANLE